MTAPLPAVAVVIVNWRAAEMTLAAVQRARAQSLRPAAVFVVDNGSGDGSAEVLARALELHSDVVMIVSPINKGFGGGCNLALDRISSGTFDFVWFLNNDAEPEPDCLDRLVDVALSVDPPAGLVGSCLHDPHIPSSAHFGSWMNPVTLMCGAVHGEPDLRDHPLSWVTAASMLMAVPTLRRTGGFDEAFFMYWEDADLNMRVRAVGDRVLCAPEARVAHSAGTSSNDIPVQRYLWHFESQRLWLHKHHRLPFLARLWLRAKFLLKAVSDLDIKRFTALARA